jgi:hypothetical protein
VSRQSKVVASGRRDTLNVFRMANSDLSLCRLHPSRTNRQPHVVPAQSRDIASESRACLSVAAMASVEFFHSLRFF